MKPEGGNNVREGKGETSLATNMSPVQADWLVIVTFVMVGDKGQNVSGRPV